MHNEFTAVFAKAEEGGYWAYCLEIPAVGQGETVEACAHNLREAMLLVLEIVVRMSVRKHRQAPGNR